MSASEDDYVRRVTETPSVVGSSQTSDVQRLEDSNEPLEESKKESVEDSKAEISNFIDVSKDSEEPLRITDGSNNTTTTVKRITTTEV